jgi:hypothetical protein
MTIPAALFEVAIWGAVVAVTLGGLFLLGTLIRDWRRSRLW